MNKLANIKLPNELTKNGFYPSDKADDQIDKNKLLHIINFIELNFYKSKYISKKQTSYALKHFVERNINTYVLNGELIASMIICGYKYKRVKNNCFFNVKQRCIY